MIITIKNCDKIFLKSILKKFVKKQRHFDVELMSLSGQNNLSHKIGTTLQPVIIIKKLEQDLKPKEIKPLIANQQGVVYLFSCDLCDADYLGYTA